MMKIFNCEKIQVIINMIVLFYTLPLQSEQDLKQTKRYIDIGIHKYSHELTWVAMVHYY